MTSSTVRHDWFATPILPLNNIYSSLLLPLLFAKLLTGTILADYTYRVTDENSIVNDFYENAQTLFRQCLKLNQNLVEHYVNIDCECLLHLARIGRLQKRSTLTTMPLKTIVQQLTDAIRACYLSTNDNQFIQTCYFELATVLLDYLRLPMNRGERKMSIKSLTVSETSEQPTTPLSNDRPSILKSRQTNSRSNLSLANDGPKRQQLKQAAAVAMRAATLTALNQKHR